jgi:hypothetical protein
MLYHLFIVPEEAEFDVAETGGVQQCAAEPFGPILGHWHKLDLQMAGLVVPLEQAQGQTLAVTVQAVGVPEADELKKN